MSATGDMTPDAAIEAYLASITDKAPRTQHSYRSFLSELAKAFPDRHLKDFEAAEATAMLSDHLDNRYGHLAAATYSRAVSLLKTFIAWQVERGHLDRDPAEPLERRAVEPKSRIALSRDQVGTLIRSNPDPRDAVPLRLLFLTGIQKEPLRHLQFRDFDKAKNEVLITRGGRPHVLRVEDASFWSDVEKLRALRQPAEDEHILPEEKARRYNPTPAELQTMEANGWLEDGRRYLRQKPNGKWERVTIVDPNRPRGTHGAQHWWYRCVWGSGLVPPGTVGLPMSTARHTVGRNLLVEGGLKAVQRGLTIGRGGSTGDVYSNRDADQLEATIRRLRPQLRTKAGEADSVAPDTWWKSPIARLVEYIVEERDLVELSRVSIEMLRSQSRDSLALRDAAATLTRVVSGSKLIDRAQEESSHDHPQLHGHSLVGIWAALETMAIDVVTAWLQHQPAARMEEHIAEMKVPYSLFETLTPEERVEFLAHELDSKRATRIGIDRFEALLDAVGLSGTHDRLLGRNIYEMQQIRNVFAHKRGIADRRFVDACPQLNYVAGETILIDRNTWSDFMVNALVYAETVLRRMKEQLGMTMRERSTVVRPIRYVRT